MLAKAYNKMTETVQLCLVLQAIEWESAVLVCVFFMERTEKIRQVLSFRRQGCAKIVCFVGNFISRRGSTMAPLPCMLFWHPSVKELVVGPRGTRGVLSGVLDGADCPQWIGTQWIGPMACRLVISGRGLRTVTTSPLYWGRLLWFKYRKLDLIWRNFWLWFSSRTSYD